jgi:transposase
LIRRVLTDGQWQRIEPLISGKKGDKGRHGEDNRLFVDAVVWLVRAGAPGRDLPEEFGKWNSMFRRFRRWAKKSVWERLFTKLGCLRSGSAKSWAFRRRHARGRKIFKFRARNIPISRKRGCAEQASRRGREVWTRPPNCYWQR